MDRDQLYAGNPEPTPEQLDRFLTAAEEWLVVTEARVDSIGRKLRVLEAAQADLMLRLDRVGENVSFLNAWLGDE